MNFSKNYLLASIGLAAIFVMGVIPADISSQVDSKYYGAATISLIDVDGNELFTQTVHNQVVDTGEEFLLDQVFQDSTTSADDVQIGSICISDPTAAIAIAEGETAADFDGDNQITETNCQEDTSVTTTGGTAVIGPINFIEPTHMGLDTIDGIGICQARTGTDAAFNNCATAGILFAVVDTSNIPIASGESVDVTYTFDITSPSD